MDGRIVVSFRIHHAPEVRGRSFLERARALEVRARASDAHVVGWDASAISFAFAADKISQALALVTTPGSDTDDGETPWSVGIAQGDLRLLAEDGSQGHLAWGAPLVASSVLAASAHPGDVLCAQTMRAVRSGELLTSGTRVGRDGSLRVRGVRLDRHHPWRRQAVEQLARMRVAPLVRDPRDPRDPLSSPRVRGEVPATVEAGSMLVLRADPGTGGTRALTELAVRSPRALVISPSGSGFEPLGALRRAFARSMTRELSPLLLEVADSLEALVGGDGVTLDVAARLISAFLSTKTEAPALLLIDDAKNVDPATLEACALAVRGGRFGLVARLDATGGLPSTLAALPTTEIEVPPLSREAAERLAGGCTNDALDAVARKRWARLAANVPLAVVESVAYGIATGDLLWNGAIASPRSRTSGRGKVRGAADWVLLRARDESASCRTVLCLIALLGGEAKVTRLARVLWLAQQAIDVDVVLEELIRGRWLVDTQEDWVALASRTHREALSVLLEAEMRTPLHAAAAEILEDEEGAFGRVEAAWQANQAGDGARASRILLAAARAAAHARIESSTTQLIAFARRANPSCEEAALELLANALARTSVLPPRVTAERPIEPVSTPEPEPAASAAPTASYVARDSEPPTLARAGVQQMPGVAAAIAAQSTSDTLLDVGADSPEPAPVSAGVNIATRLGELAKDALLSADNAALERWVDGLHAAGENPMFTERLRALSRLGRGDIGDALRVLRRTRSTLEPNDHKLRCQTSLALGVALSVAGRPEEALLEGMDALARARDAGDDRGAHACIAFLSKLFASVGRDSDRLRIGSVHPPGA